MTNLSYARKILREQLALCRRANYINEKHIKNSGRAHSANECVCQRQRAALRREIGSLADALELLESEQP